MAWAQVVATTSRRARVGREQPPAKVQAALCNAGYHTTRKEIMNYRERMAMKAKMAPDVEPQEMLLAIAEASPDGPPNA